MRSGPTLFHQCLVTKSMAAQRFHEQRLCVFQNVVTSSSVSENNFVWKLTFINTPTPSRKRAEATEENGKYCSVFFSLLALSSCLPFYTHSANMFQSCNPVLEKTAKVIRKQRYISTTLCKVSVREEHKQENVAFHTRATCVHPTINKQPSMLPFECLNYNESFKTCPHVHFCSFAQLDIRLMLTIRPLFRWGYKATDHGIDHASIRLYNRPYIALEECV